MHVLIFQNVDFDQGMRYVHFLFFFDFTTTIANAPLSPIQGRLLALVHENKLNGGRKSSHIQSDI